MIAGNSFREESICCQILGPLTLIDLFPYWEQTFNHRNLEHIKLGSYEM